MGQKSKKDNFFEKFLPKSLQNEKFALSLHSQSNQWWIHLRARIRASHARHRGSNPLSTTKDAEYQRLIFLSIFQTFLKDISTTLDDAEIDEVYLGDARFKQNKSLADEHQTECKKQRPRFKFSMVNIPIGATITFVPTGLDVKVADEDHVEYEGRIYKLSPFVGTFMPEDKRNTSGAYQGAKYFTYKGEILDVLRTKIEKGNK